MEVEIDKSLRKLDVQSLLQCSHIAKQKGYTAATLLFLIVSLPSSRRYPSEMRFHNFRFEMSDARETIVPKTGRNMKLVGHCFKS